MRTAYKVWTGIAAGVFCIVAVTDLSSSTPAQPTSSAASTAAPPAPSVPTTSAAPVVAAAPTTAPGPAGEAVTVTRVVDGDTIEVTGGRTVRFLGIDACEIGTRGGREAKDYLEIFAGPGERVRLVADGTRDSDDNGRLLRRVERVDGYSSQYDPYSNDIGTTVIGHEAVGVYGGKRNDATPAYLAALRDRDYGDRDCSGTPAPGSSGGSYSNDDGDINMPDGALTGGYCARKWWC